MLRLARSFVLLLPLSPLTLSGQQAPPDPQQAQPRPPVFRAGAHYVRVDAYPTAKDGKVVERLRIEWPVSGTLDRRAARLLDRTAKPIPVDLPVAEDTVRRTLTLEFPLAAFARGDYLVELNAGAGSVAERTLLAVRIK